MWKTRSKNVHNCKLKLYKSGGATEICSLAGSVLFLPVSNYALHYVHMTYRILVKYKETYDCKINAKKDWLLLWLGLIKAEVSTRVYMTLQCISILLCCRNSYDIVMQFPSTLSAATVSLSNYRKIETINKNSQKNYCTIFASYLYRELVFGLVKRPHHGDQLLT